MNAPVKCPNCNNRMFGPDGEADFACMNDDCPEFGQPYSLLEIESRTQSIAEGGHERELSR